MDAIAKFSKHVVETGYDDLSSEAISATKTFLLDTIGVAVAGSAGPWVEELVECLGHWGAADHSSVWVRGTKLPTPAAAMANAYQIHNSEFDCVHEAAVVHPMATVVSAALALAEREGDVRGTDLITALALGVDVACHIGVASKSPLQFFRPATAGGFGATAAVGKLMGFDTETMVNAMGVVYSQMCGTMQAHAEAPILLGMQMGFNARNSVIACDMAARGLAGTENVLEGPFGYYKLFEGDYDLTTVLANLGAVWRIAEVSHKPFPSGRATHGIVDAVMSLRNKHGFAAEDVEEVTARVPPLVHRLVSRPLEDAPAPSYARLCAAYVTSRALLRGTVDIDDFRPPALSDPETHALARRITLVADDNRDGNALVPVTVTVALKDGRKHKITLEVVYGHPANPMSREAHVEKFRRNWVCGAVPLDEAKGECLIGLVDDLEAVADIRELIELVLA